MSVNSVNQAAYTANTYVARNTTENTASKKQAEDSASKKESGVVYEKSATDRSAIIAQLKSDAEQRTAQLTSMVRDMMKNQGVQVGTADSIWRFLAGGNFTVTAAAKAKAQEAISEDGYYGVKQTSQRILDFAKALTGGDPSKAEEMRKAFEKGFKLATKSWGQSLPDISNRTYDAVMKGFDEWAGVSKTEDTEA